MRNSGWGASCSHKNNINYTPHYISSPEKSTFLSPCSRCLLHSCTPLTTRYTTQPNKVSPEIKNTLDLLIDITPRIDCYYLISISTFTENYTDFSLPYPIKVSISYKFFNSIFIYFVIRDIRYDTQEYLSILTFCNVFFPLGRHI
jgi:hypothetical protein